MDDRLQAAPIVRADGRTLRVVSSKSITQPMVERYRADQVGSFLRPPELKAAHAAFGQGSVSLAELRRLEDAAILQVLELQVQVGVDVFSDGEFRRGAWAGDFGEAVEGYVAGS